MYNFYFLLSGFINDVPTKTKDREEIVDKAGDEFKYKYDTNTTYRTGTSSPGLLVQGQVDMIQKTHRGHVTDKQEKPIQANQNVVKRSILSIVNRSKRRCALVREFGRRKRGGVDSFQSGCSGSGIDVGGSGNVITTAPVSTSTSKPTTSNALSTTEKFKSKVICPNQSYIKTNHTFIFITRSVIYTNYRVIYAYGSVSYNIIHTQH